MEKLFGILYYPFQLLIQFLNRISTISETGTAIIHIPAFSFSFMGYNANLWNEYSYDLNSILTTDIFKTIHTIYLTVVDFLLWLGLIYLSGRVLANVLGGSADTAIPDYEDTDEYEDREAYRSYTRTKKFALNDKKNASLNKNNRKNKIGF